MFRLQKVLLVLSLLSLPGCAAVALTAGSMAAGLGVEHTLGGITYKTFVSPVANLRLATLKTLSRMDMRVTDDRESEEGWVITATASERTIEIELERLTDRATRMRVVANKGNFFFKDGATATEIIIQTAEALDRDALRAAQAD